MSNITKSIIKEWYCKKIGKFYISNADYEEIQEQVENDYYVEILDPEENDKYDFDSPDVSHFRKTITIGDDTFDIEITSSKTLSGFYNFVFIRTHSQFVKRPKLDGGDPKKYSQELNDFEYGLTNSYKPIEVLKYIQSVLYTFIKRHSPRGIKFKDYDEGRREKVYDYIAKKISEKSGYFLTKSNSWFFLFRDKQDMQKTIASLQV